jgi:DNA-directed RNA polymerase subunit K/omega
MRIREGSEPLVEVDSKNPLTIALTELAAGMIHPEAPLPTEEEEETATEAEGAEEAAE